MAVQHVRRQQGIGQRSAQLLTEALPRLGKAHAVAQRGHGSLGLGVSACRVTRGRKRELLDPQATRQAEDRPVRGVEGLQRFFARLVFQHLGHCAVDQSHGQRFSDRPVRVEYADTHATLDQQLLVNQKFQR